MTIVTKFNIGDKGQFNVNFNPQKGEIIRIEVTVFEDKGYIPRYTIKVDGYIIKEFVNMKVVLGNKDKELNIEL